MKKNRAGQLLENIRSMNEREDGDTTGFIMFNIRGPAVANGLGNNSATGSVKDLMDLFRSKYFVEGRDYYTYGPNVVAIDPDLIDDDINDMLRIQGGEAAWPMDTPDFVRRVKHHEED